MKSKQIFIGVLSALTCEILFGFSYLFTKNASKIADTFSILGWRFFIAFAVMGICTLTGLIKIDLKRKSIKPLLIVTLFSPCLYFIGETVGISNTTASESGVFLACIPVASLIASTLILKKKPSKIQTAGISITLLGVLITVAGVGISSSFSITGYSFLFMAVISYALYSVFVEKSDNYTSSEITFVMLMSGFAVFTIIAVCNAVFKGTLGELILLPFKEVSFAVAVVYQGVICSVAAFFLSNIAIANIGVNRTSSFIGISTVVSILAGVFILRESFNVYQIIGSVIIIIGVYTANTKNS